MPKEYEYHEGKQAQQDFEQGMKALFHVPNDAITGKKKRAKNAQGRTSEFDISRDSAEA